MEDLSPENWIRFRVSDFVFPANPLINLNFLPDNWLYIPRRLPCALPAIPLHREDPVPAQLPASTALQTHVTVRGARAPSRRTQGADQELVPLALLPPGAGLLVRSSGCDLLPVRAAQLWTDKVLSRRYFSVKVEGHVGLYHAPQVSLRDIYSCCFRELYFYERDLLQFYILCIRFMCDFRFCFCFVVFPQIGHSNGFWPVCCRWCTWKGLDKELFKWLIAI